MLLLTRRVHESITICLKDEIGSDIMVYVVGKDKSGAPRIGIEAPKNIKVMRTEVLNRDKLEREGNI